MRSHGPEAVDFLATIHAKERIPGGAAAFAVLDDTDRATLDRLLDSYHDQGLTATLERQARTFLISYREIDKHAGVLDAAERERLDQILAEPGDLPRVPTAPRRRSIPWRWVSAALAVFVTIGLGVGVESYVSSPQSGPPPAAGSRRVSKSSLRPRTCRIYGVCFASERWTVSPGAPGWQQDLGGNVAAVSVTGDHADITDADGNPYIVGINQPFVISGTRGPVLLIDRTGTALAISLARATAVRPPCFPSRSRGCPGPDRAFLLARRGPRARHPLRAVFCR